jgi:3-methyladenine DNA glycosylase AlkD
MQEIVAQVRRNLEAGASPERAAYEKKYLKSTLEFLGSNSPSTADETKRIVRENKGMTRKELLELEAALWATKVHELRSVACGLLSRLNHLLEPEDMNLLRDHIEESAGWALVDYLSLKTVGPLVARLSLYDDLDRWAKDESFWVRRAAMLSLHVPMRAGDLAQWDRFTGYASAMIGEKEFFIRKAIGWILREVSKKNPEPVHQFLKAHWETASGLTKREGSKYLPAQMKADLGLQ